MNIAILNAEAGGNKGAEAMLEVLILKTLEEFPHAKLYLEVGSKVKYYNEVFLSRFNNKEIQLLHFTPKNFLKPYNINLKNIDCAIDIGGINFHGGSLRGTFRNLVRFLPFINNKVKLIFFTQDIGPSEKKLNTLIGRYILSKANAVFTRSETSFQQVVNSFRIKKEKVFGPFPDTTLVYKPNDVFVSEMLTDKEYVVLTPSAIMYSKHGQEYSKLFIDLFYKLSPKYKILILVHNFSLNIGSTDTFVCSELHKMCPGSIFINENMSTGVLKSILFKAKFSISSRYHVVVGSISQDVPSIAIGWNPKYESFLKLYNKENWNIDFSSNSLKEIDELINNEEFVNSENLLAETNTKLREKVYGSFKLLFKKIKE